MRTHIIGIPMNRKFHNILLLLVMALFTFSSCFEDEKETVYSDNCNITAFSLGSMKQSHHMKGSKGQDSIYYSIMSGGYFPMSINQRDLIIENRDSLPYGVQVDKVLTSCTFESILLHRPKDITGLEPVDTAWVAYSNKDSIDFTRPREFMVVAADGISVRRYTVKVNVHQMDFDQTVWDSLEVSDVPCPAECQMRKMAVLGGNIQVLAQLSDGSLQCYTREAQKVGAWKQQAVTTPAAISLETLQTEGNLMYASSTEGTILYSSNGFDWHTRQAGAPALKLMGVSHDYFYAQIDGKLMRSSKSAEAWEEEALDDAAELLPTKDVKLLEMTQSNGIHRLLLTGISADGTQPRLWSKSWTKDGEESQAEWAYYTENDAVKVPFPILAQTNVMAYGNSLVLFGGAPVKASGYLAEEALGRLYQSYDYGMTWQRHDAMTFDSRLPVQAADAQFITAATEEGRFIWMLLDGQLWRGRLNKVAFK